MRLDTITKIEQFLENVLLSSERIPLGVNVVRLASTTDEEGITAMGKSIVVRYVNSSVVVTNRVPMSVERTMSFQIIHSAQSYLSESGHDAALQMCAGAYLELNATTPFETGVEILEPFSMASESFDGLTDSSHYVYVQTWQIKVLEIDTKLIMHPCVYAGNCRSFWASRIGGEQMPGDVVHETFFYEPVLPPPSINMPYDDEWRGVVVEENDLVYVHDRTQVFLYDWTRYTLVSTGTFDESGKFLICSAKDENGDHEFTYFASNMDKRGFLGAQVNNGRSLYLPTNTKHAYTSNWPKTTYYLDPTDEDGQKEEVPWGRIITVDLGAVLTVDGETFYRAVDSFRLKVWLKEGDFVIYERNNSYPEECLGLETENQGPQECA